MKYFNSVSIIILFIISTYNYSYAQTNTSKETELRDVFNKLVLAYGNAKSPPELRILNTGKIQKSPAVYYTSLSPVIMIDINLYDICATFDENKLNALSVILSHELAHYYNDDTFCTDFAYAIRTENNDLSNKLKQYTKPEKVKMEIEADHKGLFYAAMAGYKPFGLYNDLLDKIYKSYNLPDKMSGYPSLEERKSINNQAQNKVANLYKTFQEGIISIERGNYKKAVDNFEELNKYFPSRENYNNVGVAKTYLVIQQKPITRNESKYQYQYPERFKYPLAIDKESRLKHPESLSNPTRGNTNSEELIILLKSAQKDFEKAISLDPTYTTSYINLSCVFDLLGNPMAAIGKIKELTDKKQKTINAQRILAIAYYNADMDNKAEEIWEGLDINDNEKY